MTPNRFLLASLFSILLAGPAPGSQAADIDAARRDIARLRYDSAASQLVDIAKSSHGEEKQEALFLLAGLKSSASEAEIIYQEIIRIDPDSRWSESAQIELAKIQYAVGNYGHALDILERSGACERREEACYFQGISAVMLKRYPAAREALSRIHRGKFRAWASLSLAEIDTHTNMADDACRKYESLARSAINPTGMYRYGECLEKKGRAREARRVFEDIIGAFRHTPEAILAAQKLEVIGERPRGSGMGADQAVQRVDGVGTGAFTIQFGSFHERTNAIKLAADLKQVLPGVRIDSDLVNNKEVHRVRFGRYQTRGEAQEAARAISDKISEPYSIMTLP